MRGSGGDKLSAIPDFPGTVLFPELLSLVIMISEHKKYELFGRMIFEKMVIIPPFKRESELSEEACFLHIVKGEHNIYAETASLKVQTNESVLMKCGNYLGKIPGNKNSAKYEAIVIHFHPEVIRKVYGDNVPDFLFKTGKQSGHMSLAKCRRIFCWTST